MEDVLRQTQMQMTLAQKKFICDEAGISIEELNAASGKQLDEIYDMLCEIEIEESISDSELSDRGKLAESLVTLMGNAIAEDMGILDESDEEAGNQSQMA